MEFDICQQLTVLKCLSVNKIKVKEMHTPNLVFLFALSYVILFSSKFPILPLRSPGSSNDVGCNDALRLQLCFVNFTVASRLRASGADHFHSTLTQVSI